MMEDLIFTQTSPTIIKFDLSIPIRTKTSFLSHISGPLKAIIIN